ncbi:acyltransferase [Sandarakinorhabdus sp.]|uniref:acyltransferase family protein n=1 Tax=Sandarakinorhabdus sp. TaxID=1916663 RepID=UPI00286E2D1B|nr:acyltransferase [Sandarakinorhabdus sp.]
MTTVSPTTSSNPSPARRFDLDWLRIAAFGLLILYHAGMAFVTWDWHIKLARLEWLEPVMLFTNAWRLMLLFLIAGIASSAMLRKGEVGFLASRSWRLLLPLLTGVVLVVPPQSWVELQDKGVWSGSFYAFWSQAYFRFKGDLGVILPTWNHLWFVVYLWVYTCLLAFVGNKGRAWLTGAIDRALSGGRFVWLPMLAIAVIRITLADRFPERHDLVSDWCLHWLYGGAFLVGAAMGTAGTLWDEVRLYWRTALALGVAGWAVAAAINGLPGTPEGIDLAVSRLARAIQAWGMIVGLLGAGQRWLSFDHPWREPLAGAVFPAYLIHQTIIVLMAFWLKPLAISLAAKAALLLAATALGTALFCAATAAFALLRPWVGHGPARQRLRQHAGAESPAA